MELNYDDMLNKMNLKYFNGTFYKEPPVEPKPEKLTKEDYKKIIYSNLLQRAESKRRQVEKRKLLISAANGQVVQINTHNSFFKLNLPNR